MLHPPHSPDGSAFGCISNVSVSKVLTLDEGEGLSTISTATLNSKKVHMFKKLMAYFGYAPYSEARYDGWSDCENMVFERIKHHYPSKYDKMIEDLLQ